MLIRVHRSARMNESSIMLLAGPGSAYGGNEFRGELDDNCPTMDLVK